MSRNKVSIETARKTLGDLVNAAALTGAVTIITRNGRPAARIAPLEDTMTATITDLISALDARGVDTTDVDVKPDGVHWLGRVAFDEDGTMDDGRTAFTFTVWDGDTVVTTDGGDVTTTADAIAGWLRN